MQNVSNGVKQWWSAPENTHTSDQKVATKVETWKTATLVDWGTSAKDNVRTFISKVV